MRRIAMLLAFALATTAFASRVDAQQQKADSGIKVRLTGNLYFAPEVWPNIGMDDDQKVGLGLGGMIGLALVIGDMHFGVGPHFGYNLWTADYSSKPSSATKSVNFGMADVGIEAALTSGGTVIYLGGGTSTMDAYMMLDDGSEYRYPGLDTEEFGYQTVGVGFVKKRLVLGLIYTSYKGGAKDASHLQIRLGVTR